MSVLVLTSVVLTFHSSPHLVEVRERFRIDGRPIRRETFASYFWDVYNKLEESKVCLLMFSV